MTLRTRRCLAPRRVWCCVRVIHTLRHARTAKRVAECEIAAAESTIRKDGGRTCVEKICGAAGEELWCKKCRLLPAFAQVALIKKDTPYKHSSKHICARGGERVSHSRRAAPQHFYFYILYYIRALVLQHFNFFVRLECGAGRANQSCQRSLSAACIAFYTRHVRILCKLEAAPAIITVTYLHNWLFRLILRWLWAARAFDAAQMFSVFLSLSLWVGAVVCLARGFYILLSDAKGTLIDHWLSLLRFACGREKIAVSRSADSGAAAGLGSFATVPVTKTQLLLPQLCVPLFQLAISFILSLEVWIANVFTQCKLPVSK